MKKGMGIDLFYNSYRKLKVVGKGAFGTAILYEKPNGKKVVVKEISLSEMSPDEHLSALNEVRILSALNHPNIISYYNSQENEDVLLIEMEYADGGTLCQMLTQQTRRLAENIIIRIFSQLANALAYMHSRSILHRDLKTANIFLNNDGTVKVGDFGISKIMLTKACAQTVLGTPYYMSPEMCEGKIYDDKSDMWAAGCILYEMATYQKPFTATSLPALVGQIMKGQTQELPSGYSPSLRQLVRCLLEVDVNKRASAIDVLNIYLPQIYEHLGSKSDIYRGTPSIVSESDISPNVANRSMLYQLKPNKAEISLKPISLPTMVQIHSVSVSATHFIVATEDGITYSWGQNSHGQLGNGEKSSWKQFPHVVKALDTIKITNVCAGHDFSLFLTNDGKVYSCGNGCYGCLGLGDFLSSPFPKLISLPSIVKIKCGPYHIIALGANNDLYAWGRGSSGALGLGDETNRCLPVKFHLHTNEKVSTIFCGSQCSAVLLENGTVLVCGCNFFNKLGVFERDAEKILTMTVLNNDVKIIHVSFGENHTAMLVEGGYIITLGQNTKAELGIGNTKKYNLQKPLLVKDLTDRFIKMMECGPNYTVCVCENQVVSMWGTIHENLQSNYYAINSKFTAPAKTNNQNYRSIPGQTTKSFAYYLTELNQSRTIEMPEDILVLYASENQIAKNNTLTINGIFPLSHSIILVVDTSVSLN